MRLWPRALPARPAVPATDPGEVLEEPPRDREHGWLDARALVLEAQRRADPEAGEAT
jgi:hypothetical protein